MAREKEELEEKRAEEKKTWEDTNDRAQRRIADLKEENQRLKEDAEAEAEKEQGQKRSEEGGTRRGEKNHRQVGGRGPQWAKAH